MPMKRSSTAIVPLSVAPHDPIADAPAMAGNAARIDAAHIAGSDGDGAGLLHMPSSMTDRQQAGAEACLAPAARSAIARWREVGGIDQGFDARMKLKFDADSFAFPGLGR